MESKYFDCEYCGCKADLNNENTLIEVTDCGFYFFCCKECRDTFMGI